jgi:hypothetical protein
VVDDPDLGAMVGLAGDVLVSYGACPGLPCPILATDVSKGSRSVVTDAAAGAALVATADGPRLVHEAFEESGIVLRAVALDGSVAESLGPVPDGLRLQVAPSVAESGTRMPSGWVVLSPDGRIPGVGPNGLTHLRHVPDGTTVQLDEVAR